jgi:hypothetical protein
MSKKPVITESLLGINPLSMSLQIKVRQLKTAEALLTEFTEGVHMPIGKLEKTIILEESEYSKVYHDTFWRDIIIDLNPKALQIWTFITFDLDRNKDYYWVNSSFLVSKLGLRNKKTLDDLIKSHLVRYGLLATSTIEDVYWVNPSILFCGNRVEKYPKSVSIR